VSQPQPVPVNGQDLLLLLGQNAVELAYLRGRLAELERRLAELDPVSNSKTDEVPVE
jgi:hypothetical protein